MNAGREFGAVSLSVLAVVCVFTLASFSFQRNTPHPGGVDIAVNIPAFRMDVFVDGARTASYRVAVGSRAYPSPVGEFRITTVEWNPWWNPPAHEWAAGAAPVPPGPKNPMGRAKLRFLPLYYVHGTPDTLSLGKPLSHGCIRLADQDAIAVARLVSGGATPSVDEMARLARDSLTIRVPLAPGVPLRIRYEIAEVRDDTVRVYDDVYRRDRRPMREVIVSALAHAGIDTLRIDEQRLRRFVARAQRGSASHALSELLAF